MNKGFLSSTMDWISHPTFDTTTDPYDWTIGLILIVIVAFLWSRVVKQLLNN